MTRAIGLGLAAAVAVWGCSSSSTNGSGNPGSAGSTTSGVVGTGSGGVIATSGSGGSGSGIGNAGTSVSAGSSGHPVTSSGGTSATAGKGGSTMPGPTEIAGTTGGSTGSIAGASGGPAGSAGGAAGSAGGSASGFKPPCITKGSELVTIGDSWVNYVEQLNPELTMRAQAAGDLAANDSYQDYAVPGTSLASGGIGLIPPQWDQAYADNPDRKFAVMDGGGNDVLLGAMQCLNSGEQNDPTCQQVVMDATMAGSALEAKMKSQGVHQAIFFFYPHVPAGGWDVLDYSLPMAKQACEGMNDDNYQCYFVDTRAAFDLNNDGAADTNLILSDGIHPNADGEKILADLIWKTMTDHCMAQPASSGCCTP